MCPRSLWKENLLEADFTRSTLQRASSLNHPPVKWGTLDTIAKSGEQLTAVLDSLPLLGDKKWIL